MQIAHNDPELLKKSIEMLSKLIHRQSIRDILRQEAGFFIPRSGADVITVYVKKDDSLYVEFIMEKKKILYALLKKYDLHKKSSALNRAVDEITNSFNNHNVYRKIDSLCPILKGTIPEKKCRRIETETHFHGALLFPIMLDNGEKIGVIAYYFTENTEAAAPEELKALSEVIASVITPLYDSEEHFFYSKCVQVDDDMSKLTEKERQIVTRVLNGQSYQEVADEIGITINTLKTHMKNIFAKYGVNSKMELHNKIVAE